MEPLNRKSIFFNPIKYTDDVRPNFFIIKQKESGRDRGICITALSEVYHAIEWINVEYAASKYKHPGKKRGEIEIPIQKLLCNHELIRKY